MLSSLSKMVMHREGICSSEELVLEASPQLRQKEISLLQNKHPSHGVSI